MSEAPIFLVIGLQSGHYTFQSGSRARDSMITPRCWGFYHSLSYAWDAVQRDVGGINESGHHDYLAIEEVQPGIAARVTARWWYRWDNRWEPVGQPPWASETGNGSYVMG